MKGYCIDVRGFSEEKKKKVQDAFFELGLEWESKGPLYQHLGADRYTNAAPLGTVWPDLMFGMGDYSVSQVKHLITYEELLKEAGMMKKEFTKHDLKDGMVCTYRNGGKRIYFGCNLYERTSLYLLTAVRYSHLISEDLTAEKPAMDIMKVEYMGDTIWEREERKTIQVGDKEYYEDELAEALSNIKPLEE